MNQARILNLHPNQLSTECCSGVPAPAYPPEVSPSLLHLEPQPSSDRSLSPAARHQLFTWSALLLIRWLIWEEWREMRCFETWDQEAAGKEGKGGSHLHIERREMEREFIDVGLPICSPKSWHPGEFINLWWNHRITLMNVHMDHQHGTRADRSFTGVGLLRQSGSRACVDIENWESGSGAGAGQKDCMLPSHYTPP